MVHVGGLEEAELVPAQIEELSIPEALHLALVRPALKVDPDRERAGHQRGPGCFGEEALHATALVGLEMQKCHEREAPRVEHLGDRASYGVVEGVDAGVDECRTLVVDQELVHRDPEIVRPGRDPVDVGDDLVDPRLRLCFAHCQPPVLKRMISVTL